MADRPALGVRELEVLRWVGEQYAAPMATVAELLIAQGALRSVSAFPLARRVAARLEALGYAGRRPLLGQQWLVPTRAGLRAAGLAYRVWRPDRHEWSARHIAACGRLRLHLSLSQPEARWESDRAIRARWAGQSARVRLADGGLWWSDGTATGVELERHVKRPNRYRGAVEDRDPAWSEVWWFTPPGQVELLRRQLAEAGAGDVHQVYPLPREVDR